MRPGKKSWIADRFIRAYYREMAEGNAHIRQMIERLSDLDRRHSEKLLLEETESGWTARAV